MRVVVAMLGLVLALLLQAAPAAAHHVTTAQDKSAVDPDQDHDHDQDQNHHHDGSQTHDPTKHSHPFGEDPLHELMFHGGGLDHVSLATYSAAVSLAGIKMARAVSHVSLSGITVPPPLRPPLV